MRLDRAFRSHFAPHLGPGGSVVGVLPVTLGPGFRGGVLAILLGNVVGALPVALAATVGPVTGLPHAAHPASLATFVLATAILASFNPSWASRSSAYTRYLPADSLPSRIVWLALAGLLLSAVRLVYAPSVRRSASVPR